MRKYIIEKGFAVVDSDGDVIEFYNEDTLIELGPTGWVTAGNKCEKKADEFIYKEKHEWNNEYIKEYGFVVFDNFRLPVKCFSSEMEAKKYISEKQRYHNRGKEAQEILRRERKREARIWQKQRVENIETYGCEHPSKDMIKLHELEEDRQLQKRINLYLWGKESGAGSFYKRWLEKYEEELADEESWLMINPNNEITRANVARLRKQVEEYRKLEASFP